ncbi:MAG: hypothetical protein V3T87_00385 [Candidatus Thorarchaeota archaeon]
MSDEKIFDTRTPEEIEADLERRRKDHVFMTTEEAVAWNKAREKRPLSEAHWSVKAAKVKHVLHMGHVWKRLAKVMYTDMTTVAKRVGEMNATIFLLRKENTELKRMMRYCNKCSSEPGTECSFRCPRDGSRDT